MEPVRDEAGLDYRSVAFWNERYETNTAGWDLGQPAPPLVSYVRSLDGEARGRLVVVGCGKGNDARFFAENGWQVVGFDFSDAAVREATALTAGKELPLRFVQQDILDPGDEHDGAFDTVVEHTCFCAIDPARRDDYVRAVHRMLKPGGRLVALFYAILPPDGPPFPVSVEEIRERFTPCFEEETLFVPEDSVERRRGCELFAVFRRRD